MSLERVGWDEYYMKLAVDVAIRATCERKHVGAIIVRNKSILSTGYNGSISGTPHCDEAGHMMEDGHCVRTIHAEANALIQAARHGIRTEGATLYTTASPCWQCFKLISNSGITRVVFGEKYRLEDRVKEAASKTGILLEFLPLNGEVSNGGQEEDSSSIRTKDGG